jgi:hypothetical protein
MSFSTNLTNIENHALHNLSFFLMKNDKILIYELLFLFL